MSLYASLAPFFFSFFSFSLFLSSGLTLYNGKYAPFFPCLPLFFFVSLFLILSLSSSFLISLSVSLSLSLSPCSSDFTTNRFFHCVTRVTLVTTLYTEKQVSQPLSLSLSLCLSPSLVLTLTLSLPLCLSLAPLVRFKLF